MDVVGRNTRPQSGKLGTGEAHVVKQAIGNYCLECHGNLSLLKPANVFAVVVPVVSEQQLTLQRTLGGGVSEPLWRSRRSLGFRPSPATASLPQQTQQPGSCRKVPWQSLLRERRRKQSGADGRWAAAGSPRERSRAGWGSAAGQQGQPVDQSDAVRGFYGLR
jgi:hypothetical protein